MIQISGVTLNGSSLNDLFETEQHANKILNSFNHKNLMTSLNLISNLIEKTKAGAIDLDKFILILTEFKNTHKEGLDQETAVKFCELYINISIGRY